jgi:hypothetical protein
MNEAEWLAANDPKAMLAFLGKRATDRKLRLFGIACCRRRWAKLPDEFRAAVEVAERFADGEVTKKVLGAAKKQAGTALAAVARPPEIYSACGAAWSATRNAPTAAAYPCWVFTDEADRRDQAALLRDIAGDPFRPVTSDPSWLTPNVIALAGGIYSERAFDRLPLLADALRDAGCNDAGILAHCQSVGPHARGCWVIDLALGKA